VTRLYLHPKNGCPPFRDALTTNVSTPFWDSR